MVRSDIFFDSLDRLSSDESSLSHHDQTSSCKLGYEIWVNEPASVHERRQNFLRQTGLAEFASTTSSHVLGSDRLAVSKEAFECCCTNTSTRPESAQPNELQRFHMDEQNTSLLHDHYHAVAPSPPHSEVANKMSGWWKLFVNKNNRFVSKESKPSRKGGNKIKVLNKNKRCLELTAPYAGQEIHAHNGFIWTMKFSPDGQYLATAGEDGVVRVWHVRPVDASTHYLTSQDYFCSQLNERKSSFHRKHASVIFPDKVFHIQESPIHELYGHSSDVLDLAWSNSNCILSSSKDKTVRLWQLGCNDSLHVFHHNDYVTCIQFNPMDENYFISGSIDGKVRIWGLSEKRVVDWTDVRDVITAVCYRPDGQGFMVGSITGTCRSYKASDEGLLLDAEIHILGRKKTAANKITGIKFSKENSQRVMISSQDSKLRIFDGVDLTHKYKGLKKSGSQMSASFTSSERHIISVGEDSRVYIWNHETSHVPSSKQAKSVRSCEHFFYQGISVAVPWSGMESSSLGAQEHLEAASRTRESERFSLGSWFSTDGVCRGSATWPEEKLPLWDVSATEDQSRNLAAISETWGIVIVAAGLDGTVRTFHNYGLPVRL